MTAPAMPSIRSEFYRMVVDRFDESARCGHVAGCERVAAWRTQYHDCAHNILCDEHWKVWLKEAEVLFLKSPSVRCRECKRYFSSLEALCRAWPI